MAMALVTARQVGAALVMNGSFDNTANTFTVNHSDSGAMALGTSSTVNGGRILPGWTVFAPVGGNISWDLSASVAGGNPYGLTPSSGNGSQYFLDLTGWTDGAGGYGGVSQVVQHTVAGQQYQLSFDIGSSTRYDGTTAPGIQVMINGHAVGSPNYAAISGPNNWTLGTVDFTAAAHTTATTIRLNGVSAGGPIEYIGLDNVRLTAVPESTTVFAGAGALGLVVLGVFRSRRSGVIRIG